jgi:DNA primase
VRPLNPELRRSLAVASKTYAATYEGSAGAAYMEGRGLPTASVRPFGLGFVENPQPGHEQFAGRICIPNFNLSGVVGLKFRHPNDTDEPKYEGLPGIPGRLFNLRAIGRGGPTICLTEGELDAITVTSLGFPAVGVPGVDNWKPHDWRIFEGYERVVLVRDADQAGLTLVKKLQQTELPLVVVLPPGGHKDANAALCAGLGDELARLIRGE